MTQSLEGHRPVSEAWPGFHERLTDTLRSLAEDQFFTVLRKDTNRFVQFADGGFFGMRAEVVCNSYLKGRERLSAKDMAIVSALGWTDPTSGPGVPPELDPGGSPNFFRQWETPVDHAEIATLAVRTLIEVLDVPHPGWLEYLASDATDNEIMLPGLGLKRGD